MRALLDLVVPASCVGCGAPGAVACAPCAAVLHGRAVPQVPRPAPAGLPVPFAVAAYDGAVRAFLVAYKEEEAVGLRRLLADALATAVRAAVEDVGLGTHWWLVPVPSSRAARRRRGADVVGALARHSMRTLSTTGLVVRVLPALVHARSVDDSAGLSATARAGNLRAAFRVSDRARSVVSRRPVVLVDDLVTTGTTLAECAAALRAAGATVPVAATVAATRRRTA